MANIQQQTESVTDIHRCVEAIFRDIFRDENLTIHAETSAKDIDGWDSLAHISLIVAIEKKFSIKFKLAELQDIGNVGDMLKLIVVKSGK